MWNLFSFVSLSSRNQVGSSYITYIAFPLVISKFATPSTGIKYEYDASNLHSLKHTLYAFIPCPLSLQFISHLFAHFKKTFDCIFFHTGDDNQTALQIKLDREFLQRIIIFYSIFIYLRVCFYNCDFTLNTWFH